MHGIGWPKLLPFIDIAKLRRYKTLNASFFRRPNQRILRLSSSKGYARNQIVRPSQDRSQFAGIVCVGSQYAYPLLLPCKELILFFTQLLFRSKRRFFLFILISHEYLNVKEILCN